MRLLSLLQSMRGLRGPVTALQLAQSLDVSERTIYRDLAELAVQGAPIEGEAGVGYVLRPGLFLPPLMLSEDETEAVMLGLGYVGQRGDEVLKKAAAVALAKIGSVLPAKAQAVLSAPVATPGPDGIEFPENTVSLADLRAVIRSQKRLGIVYIDEQGNQTQRFIWPFQLGFMDNARVVIAWCELRGAFRFFRTDRIVSAVAGERYPARRADLLRDFKAQLPE
jgi:predicted DNA-binding transcriptional regulator YafY